MAATILIADDERCNAGWWRTWCSDAAMKPSSSTAAMRPSRCSPRRTPGAVDAVLLDLVMPGLDGMGVLAKIREAGLNIPVIVQTAHGGIDNVVSAMRAGAHDFVVKPVGIERLQVSLRNALNASALKGELQRIRHSREGKLTFADIITRSEAMGNVMRTAKKAVGSTIPVLIEGESASARNCLRAPFTARANAPQSRLSRSIAARSPIISWSRSCSVTKRGSSPAQPNVIWANCRSLRRHAVS